MQSQTMSKSADLQKQGALMFTRQQPKNISTSQKYFDVPTLLERNKSLYYGNIPMAKQTVKWNKSAATLRNTTSSFRFSASARFPTPKTNYQDALQLQYPSLLGKRSASIGVGRKVSVPEVFGSGKFKASESAPFYQIDKDSLQRSHSAMILGKGKSFGLGWKHYQASRTPHRPSVHSSQQLKSNPGPNHYNINPEHFRKKPKIMMHNRLQMFTTRDSTYRLGDPGPQSFAIKETLVKKNRSGCSFGLGIKTDFTKLTQRTPGPIYSEKNFCDKFIHLKIKLKS